MLKPLLSLILWCACAGAAWCHGGHADGVAKADLQALFPQATSFVSKKIDWSGERRARVEKILGQKLHDHDLGMPLYIAVKAGRSLGTAWGGEADLASGSLQVVVALDLNGRIAGVRLPKSQLPVAQAAFLSQFQGKPADTKFTVGKNLKAAGNPEESAEVARAVREAAVVLREARPQ